MNSNPYKLVVSVEANTTANVSNLAVDLFDEDEEKVLDSLADFVYEGVTVSFFTNFGLEEPSGKLTMEDLYLLLEYRKFLIEHDEEECAILRIVISLEGFGRKYSFLNETTLQDITDAFYEYEHEIVFLDEIDIIGIGQVYVNNLLEYTDIVSEDKLEQLMNPEYFNQVSFGIYITSKGWLDTEIRYRISDLYDELLDSPAEHLLDDLQIQYIGTYKTLEKFVENMYKNQYDEEDAELLDNIYLKITEIYEYASHFYFNPENVFDEIVRLSGDFRKIFKLFVDEPIMQRFFNYKYYAIDNLEDIISEGHAHIGVLNDLVPGVEEAVFLTEVFFRSNIRYAFRCW